MRKADPQTRNDQETAGEHFPDPLVRDADPLVRDAKEAVLYLVARFPKISETFVFNEWWEMTRRFRMEFASLRKTREQPLHRRAERLLRVTHFTPLLGVSTLWANTCVLARSPQTYLDTFISVATSNERAPGAAAWKGVGVFIKAVAVVRLVEKLNVRHVHAHFANHPATAAWVIHRLSGVPFSFTAHANDLFLDPPLIDKKVEDAEFVVAVSDYNRQYLRELVADRGRIRVIHCGVDPDLFQFSEPRSRAERVLSVGRLDVEKGHSVLLQAFAALVQHRPRLKLDIVGSGPELERLERLRNCLGLGRNVRFHGAVTSDAVRALLADADAFALASIRHSSGAMDGIPVALMEAMSAGVPVVASDLSGIPELVIDGVTGLLARAGDPLRFADALRKLLDDRNLARLLAANARGHIEECFTLGIEAERLGQLFESSLRDREERSRLQRT